MTQKLNVRNLVESRGFKSIVHGVGLLCIGYMLLQQVILYFNVAQKGYFIAAKGALLNLYIDITIVGISVIYLFYIIYIVYGSTITRKTE